MIRERLLLGIDEGTTGVKAVLFDERLQPVREARRDKVNRHPRPGWVEQDGEEVLAAVVEAVAELLEDAPGDVVACGLDHQGESVLAWDAESGKPLTPIVVWQDKRSQEVLDRLAGREAEVKETSGLPFDPYFSAAKLAWLLEHDEGVQRAREAGRLRMGTVDSFLCDRLGAGFATDASTASRTQLHALGRPGFDPALCEVFGVPTEVLPEVRDTIGDWACCAPRAGRWSCALRARRWTSRPRSRARAASCPAVSRPPTAPASSCSPTWAKRSRGRRAACFQPSPGASTAGSSTPSTAACSRRGDARVDVPGAGSGGGPGGARRAGAERRRLGGRAACCPGLAGIGAPWWKPDARAVLAGLHGGTTGANVARAALEGIAWRVADMVAAIRESVDVDDLRVDGGLTNEPLLLELQADAIGVPVEAGGADATVAGAAALAAVGAGVIGSLSEAAELLPVDRRVEPGATTPGARPSTSAGAVRGRCRRIFARRGSLPPAAGARRGFSST